MKMIIAILPDSDTENVMQALIKSQFRVTQIASTGGFLRRGMSTLLLGVDDERVEDAIQLIRHHCAPPIEPSLHRATLFVLPVERFERV